jgi:hypothetical protein
VFSRVKSFLKKEVEELSPLAGGAKSIGWVYSRENEENQFCILATIYLPIWDCAFSGCAIKSKALEA